MSQQQLVQVFDAHKVRIIWDDQQEKYYFSIVDVVQVLTESENPQTYWRVLKKRLLDEGNETVTNCNALKMPAPDGKMRLTDVADTEQVLRLVQSVPSKKAEPLKRWLAQVGQERLNQMSGLSTRQYKNYKGLRKENLRDNMTDVELMLSGLAEATSTALSKKRNPKQMSEHVGIAKEGGEVARSAREDIEHRLGESVISPKKAIDIATPKDELPFEKEKK